MKRALLTLCAVASIALVVACTGDDDDASPAATLGTSTTSTTLSVEQEVEAAYLRSWDVYAEAMLTFDTSQLAEAYAERSLESRSDEVRALEAANTPARMDVEHDYEITVDGDEAVVRDRFVNHSVLLDASTGEPAEADPNNELDHEFRLKRVGGEWKVVLIVEH